MLWAPDSMFFPLGEKWLKTHLLVKSNNGHEHHFRRVTPGLTRAHEHYFLKGPAANHTQRLQINLISIFKAYQPRWYPLHESYLSIQDLFFFLMFFRWQEKSLPPCIVGRKKRGHTLESDLLFLRVLVMRAPVKEVREFWGSSLGQTSRSSLLIFVPWFSYSLIFLFSRLKNFSPGVFYSF